MSIKQNILDSAQRLYAENGYAGFSMRKVAKLAGISTMATYRHFESKDHLLHHVVVHGFSLFTTYQERADPYDDPWERIHRQNLGFLDFATDHQAFYEIMFLSTDEVSKLRELTPDGRQILERSFGLLRQRLVDVGVAQADATNEAIRLWSLGHGLVSLHLSGRFAFLDVDFADYYVQQTRTYLDQLRERLAS